MKRKYKFVLTSAAPAFACLIVVSISILHCLPLFGARTTQVAWDVIDLQGIRSMLDQTLTIQQNLPESQDTSFQGLQNRLSCLLRHGAWNKSALVVTPCDISRPTRLDLHRCSNSTQPSDSYEYTFSEKCFPSAITPLASAKMLCPRLPGKKILFVGPDTTYRLHTSWLEALEKHENRSHACLGIDFCTFHQICREPAQADEPFLPPGGFVKFPSNHELISTHSAVLRYDLSTTLYAGGSSRDPKYTDPTSQVDGMTGVRMPDLFWLTHARKSNVIVMNRGPLPAPAYTYDGSATGNWTFVENIGYSMPEVTKVAQAQKIVAAALNVTITRFISEVTRTLEILRRDPDISHKILIWHGSWFATTSRPEVWQTNQDTMRFPLDNPWLLYHNIQGRSPLFC
ncbi:hypothetical protein D9758_008447 [Tetrapyrgos nigripes]|uniref:Uncharacterized protein n=1 Tax=Tetrapyrgos nigripes TaxID=182062 RepID=A0A8H5CQT5_9AGAR|nr:hypothetical protein D9758_008447 [Tetrapyrgos nigripes]